MYMLAQRTQASWEPYVHYKGVFSAQECADIVALHKIVALDEARVGNDEVSPKIRRSHTGWIKHCSKVDWIFERLSGLCNDAREHWYPFALSGFVEPLQLTRYDAAQQGHYAMHRDMGPASQSTRKLSLVVMLTDPADYAGGALEVLSVGDEDPRVKDVAQGTVVVFPAWEMHRVTPVTHGTRWSLVAWVHGPRFI